MSKNDKPVNLGRHQRICTVCAHNRREEIEADFVGWNSPAAIASEYGLKDRATIYRHAHAFGLFQKRQRNIRAALERIIERAGEVEATASAVVAAIQAYSKINATGEWIDRTETLSINDLFNRMALRYLTSHVLTLLCNCREFGFGLFPLSQAEVGRRALVG